MSTSPMTQHVHLDNKRRNLEEALQHYHYAMDIDDLCSKIRLMVPNSVVAFAGLGPCARATEQDQNLLKALTNVLKSEFKQNSEALLGRIRGTLKREPLLNPLLARLNRDLFQRVYIPKGPPNPIPLEAYQTLAELARLESTVASALAKIYNVVMPHALLDQDPH